MNYGSLRVFSSGSRIDCLTVDFVFGEPAVSRMVVRINFDVLNRIYELSEVHDFGGMRAFDFVGVREGCEWVTHVESHPKLFLNFSLQAGSNVFPKVDMATRQFVNAWEKFLGIGSLGPEKFFDPV